MERELVRTKQLVEQQEQDLKQKTEHANTLREQLNAFQMEKSNDPVHQKAKELEESMEKLTVQLSQSETEKQKQVELVYSLTKTLDEERMKHGMEQEIRRTTEILEEMELDLEHKNEDIVVLKQQINVYQQEKVESTFQLQQVKELEKSLELVTAQLRDSEAEMKERMELKHNEVKVAGEQSKVPFEESQGVRNILRAMEERHAAELERQKLELNERLAEEGSQLRQLHSRQIESLIAEHEMELNLLKAQDTAVADGDDEEYLGTLFEAVNTSVRIDSSFIDESLEELPTNLELILKKLHTESIEVLSLSDVQYLHGLEQHFLDMSKAEAAWLGEKKSLLAAIQALKQLLSRINQAADVRQVYGESDVVTEDWRSDLLKAVHDVFAKEKDMLHVDLRTYRTLHPTDDRNYLEVLEKLISDQETLHHDYLERLISVDHQSLIQELDSLIQRNKVLRRELQQERDKATRNPLLFEDQFSHKERELKHQVDTVEFKLKQEKVLNDDLQLRLTAEQSRLIELSTQLSKERNVVSNLQLEIGEQQVQLTKVKGQLGRERLQVQSLSSSLADEQGKVVHLNGKVMHAQMELQQSQQKLDSEKTVGTESSRRLSSTVEKLKAELNGEKEHLQETRIALNGRDVSIVALENEIESLRNQICSQESQFKMRLKDFENAANMEKMQHTELTELLEKERHSNSELRQTLDQEHENQHTLLLRFQNTIADLQANLDMERSKALELTLQVERDRCRSFAVDEEKSQLQEKLTSESTVCNQLRQGVKNLTAQKQELQMELQLTNQKLSVLQIEHTRLQTSLGKSKTALEDVECQGLEERQRNLKLEQERQNDRRRLIELESMLQAARQSVTRLEHELNASRRNEMSTHEDAGIARLKINGSPRVTFSHSTKDVPTSPTHEKVATSGQMLISESLTIYQKHLEMFCQRLHLLALRLQEGMGDVSVVRPSRSGSGVDVRLEEQSLRRLFTELTSLSSSLQLESLPSNGANPLLPAIPALNEKILRHNSDLTSYVSHLMSEKQEFQDVINELRGTIATYQDREEFLNQCETVDQMSLDLSNAREEAARLRDDLRRSEVELERERRRSFSPAAAAGDRHFSDDREKIQRLYSKYLRADCARKSLIYQKKYLLLLLGGFQDNEKATLAAISRMGAFASVSSQNIASRVRSRPLSRFRTAATVVIAISRLHLLVNRWRRTTRFGTPVMGLAQFSPVGHFGAAPLRSHSMSNVSQPSSSVPNTRVTGSALNVSQPSYLTGYAHGSSANSTPRSAIQSTPPTKERRGNYHAGQLSGDSSGNVSIFRSATPTSTTMSSSPPPDPDSTAALNNYLHRLEQIQHNLTTANSSSTSVATRK